MNKHKETILEALRDTLGEREYYCKCTYWDGYVDNKVEKLKAAIAAVEAWEDAP